MKQSDPRKGDPNQFGIWPLSEIRKSTAYQQEMGRRACREAAWAIVLVVLVIGALGLWAWIMWR